MPGGGGDERLGSVVLWWSQRTVDVCPPLSVGRCEPWTFATAGVGGAQGVGRARAPRNGFVTAALMIEDKDMARRRVMTGHLLLAGANRAPSEGWRLAALRWLWAAVTVLALLVSVAAFVALASDSSLNALSTVGVFEFSPRLAPGLEALGISLQLVERADLVFRMLGFVIFVVTAAVIFVRRSRDWMMGLTSATLIAFGASVFAPLPLLARNHPGWSWAVGLVGNFQPNSPLFGRSLGGLSFLLFLYLFPDGRFVPRFTRWMAAAVLGHVLLWSLAPGSVFAVDLWPVPLQYTWIFVVPATGLYAQVHRYAFDSSPARQHQTQLVLMALATIAAVPPLLVAVSPRLSQALPGLAVISPRVEALYELILLTFLAVALLALPLSIAVSVLRYGLWDIDLFVNRALVYTCLTASLGLAYIAAVVLLQQVFSDVTRGSTVAATISTLAVSALFRPAKNRFQALIDRRFNRRKYDAQKTIDAFGLRLRDHVNLDSLEADLLGVVGDTMQCACVGLWLRPISAARSEATAPGPPASEEPEQAGGQPDQDARPEQAIYQSEHDASPNSERSAGGSRG